MAGYLSDLGPFGQKLSVVVSQDDFVATLDSGKWSKTASGTGAIAADDTDTIMNGTNLKVTSDASSANNKVICAGPKACVLPKASNAVVFETVAQITEAATNSSNVIAGLFSADPINATSGVIPTASYSGAIFYKRGNTTELYVQSSNGSTKTTTQLSLPSDFVFSGVAHTYRIDITAEDQAYARVTYKIDGQEVKDTNGYLFSHKVAYSSLVKMLHGVGVQSHGTTAENLYADYVFVVKSRNN